MNPFDIKAVLFAKHAQHVVLVHFPIALFTVAVAFDYLSRWTKNQALAAAAYFNALIAAVSTLPVIATGLIAWRWALEGQKLKGILLFHLVLGCVVSLLIWFVLWVHLRARRTLNNRPPRFLLLVEGIAVLLIGLTGYLGGVLSGVTGGGS